MMWIRGIREPPVRLRGATFTTTAPVEVSLVTTVLISYTGSSCSLRSTSSGLPWTATVKRRYVRITPSEISGRYFEFGTQPD